MDVQIIQAQTHIHIDEKSIHLLVEDFLAFYHCEFDEVSIQFVTTEEICQLHCQYFNDPSPTDCISFPMDSSEDEGYRMMGDVFVCPETAIKYVKTHGGDVYEETTLYLVHGMLHLLGYDDIEEEDRTEMKAEESVYLSHVAQKKLWLRA